MPDAPVVQALQRMSARFSEQSVWMRRERNDPDDSIRSSAGFARCAPISERGVRRPDALADCGRARASQYGTGGGWAHGRYCRQSHRDRFGPGRIYHGRRACARADSPVRIRDDRRRGLRRPCRLGPGPRLERPLQGTDSVAQREPLFEGDVPRHIETAVLDLPAGAPRRPAGPRQSSERSRAERDILSIPQIARQSSRDRLHHGCDGPGG